MHVLSHKHLIGIVLSSRMQLYLWSYSFCCFSVEHTHKKWCADIHLPLPQRKADLISKENAVTGLIALTGSAAGSRGAAAPGWGFCSIPPNGWKCKNLLRKGLRKKITALIKQRPPSHCKLSRRLLMLAAWQLPSAGVPLHCCWALQGHAEIWWAQRVSASFRISICNLFAALYILDCIDNEG